MRSNLAECHVLIIEDEYFIADDLAEALSHAGAKVIGPARSIDQALMLLDDTTVDFAIVDINLRGDATFSVADRLADRNIPFVFATGYDAGIIPDRHRDVTVWEKPFDVDQLSQHVETALEPGCPPPVAGRSALGTIEPVAHEQGDQGARGAGQQVGARRQ